MEISSLHVAEAAWIIFVDAAPLAALIHGLTSHHPQGLVTSGLQNFPQAPKIPTRLFVLKSQRPTWVKSLHILDILDILNFLYFLWPSVLLGESNGFECAMTFHSSCDLCPRQTHPWLALFHAVCSFSCGWFHGATKHRITSMTLGSSEPAM